MAKRAQGRVVKGTPIKTLACAKVELGSRDKKPQASV